MLNAGIDQRRARGRRWRPGTGHGALTTTRIPLGRAHMLASSTIREARRAGIRTDTLTWVGSLRRYAPEISDVAILAVAPPAHHRDVLNSFRRLPIVTRVTADTPSSTTVVTD